MAGALAQRQHRGRRRQRRAALARCAILVRSFEGPVEAQRATTMNVIWKGCSPKNFRNGRAGMKPAAIVIHISDGCLSSADSWFNNPSARVSAHYIVAKT